MPNTTPHRGYPLPIGTSLEADFPRLLAALEAIDTDVAAISSLLQTGDVDYDTLLELVNAIKANQTSIAAIVSGYATKDELDTAITVLCATGDIPGWAASPSGGTPDQYAVVTYDKGLDRLRKTRTWGASGGALGNITQVVYEKSSDGGSTWTTLATKTLTYDANGYWSGTTWS